MGKLYSNFHPYWLRGWSSLLLLHMYTIILRWGRFAPWGAPPPCPVETPVSRPPPLLGFGAPHDGDVRAVRASFSGVFRCVSVCFCVFLCVYVSFHERIMPFLEDLFVCFVQQQLSPTLKRWVRTLSSLCFSALTVMAWASFLCLLWASCDEAL